MSLPATARPGREAGRVGLLGGSFNPAHAGHLHLSLVALKRLGLDAVWWMVSPQNPLKALDEMAPLEARMASARAAARHPRIHVTDIETDLGSRVTADTLERLKRRFPHIRFVWLMGADNMLQIPRWGRWAEVFRQVPVAVIARPSYSWNAMHGKAALRFRGARRGERSVKTLAARRPPAWLYIVTRQHPASATAIRARSADNVRRVLSILSERAATADAAAPGTGEDADIVDSGAPNQALLDVILEQLDDGKAEDIVTVDMEGKSAMCDFMVIASGRSNRQVAAMAEHLRELLKPRMAAAPPIEGLPQGDWVLVDAGDVVVHLFRPEVRAFYKLERMWGLETPAVAPGAFALDGPQDDALDDPSED